MNINFKDGRLHINNTWIARWVDDNGTFIFDAKSKDGKKGFAYRCETETIAHGAFEALTKLGFSTMSDAEKHEVQRFIKFGGYIGYSHGMELYGISYKLAKHMTKSSEDKVAIYLTQVCTTSKDDDFADPFAGNVPPVKEAVLAQDDQVQKAIKWLKDRGWKMRFHDDGHHNGTQLWVTKDGEGYHSDFDWNQF